VSDEPAADSPAELKARALRFLARREHSRAELSRKLAPHAESAEALVFLLDELEKRKQLSDERYAEVRAHWMARKYGAAKIRQDLKAKGVAEEVAARVSTDGELERARGILARKYRDAATTAEEKARRMRFLQGRGFSFDTIRGALAVDEEDVRS
jgi:regulatory protein